MTPDPLPRGLTTVEFARQWRVSPGKVLAWIRRGELAAVNTARRNGRPRYIILPHHAAEFERRLRAVTETPTPQPRRRRRTTGLIDYFPDAGGTA